MRRFIAIIALMSVALVCCVAPVPGAAQIALEDRVPNRSPGYCVWCALQTLGNMLTKQYPGDKRLLPLLSIVDERAKVNIGTKMVNGKRVRLSPGAGNPDKVRKMLAKTNVPYKQWPYGTQHWDELQRACDRGLGAMISFHYKKGSGHAVIVTDIGKEKVAFKRDGEVVQDYPVYIVDSNDVSKVKRYSKKYVVDHWSGWLIVIEPDAGKRIVTNTPAPMPAGEPTPKSVSPEPIPHDLPIPDPPPPKPKSPAAPKTTPRPAPSVPKVAVRPVPRPQAGLVEPQPGPVTGTQARPLIYAPALSETASAEEQIVAALERSGLSHEAAVAAAKRLLTQPPTPAASPDKE